MKNTIKNYLNKSISKKNIKQIKTNIDYLESLVLPMAVNENSLSTSVKYIEPKKLIKVSTPNERSLDRAESIMKNEFFLMNNLETISFDTKIEWNYSHHTSANTYQLYIQCLNVISYLCDGFAKNNDEKYLLKAYEILLDWIYFVKTDQEKNKFKWVDHTVANRVMNIIYFYNISKGEIDFNEEIILNLLLDHGDFLENDKNYVQNNHGIMVDRSLLLLAVFMEGHNKSTEWFQKAKLRITNAIYRDFSHNGVHLENSPSYHLMTRRIFNQVEQFLVENNATLGKEVRQKLIQMKEYIQYILKPNNNVPLIGDTQKGNITWVKKLYDSFSDSHAGITIMQSEAEIPTNSTWLSFICGYGRKTHKHRDDLSISLFYNGKDILVDSGRYNYDSKDELRKYFLSPNAHSTISILNKDYTIEDPFKYRNKIKTVAFTSNGNYDFVKGINNAYEGVSIQRSIIFFKPNIIVIFDQIESEDENTYQQIFNFSNEVIISDSNKDKVKGWVANDHICIDQIKLADSLKIYSGNRQEPRAIISEEFGKITDISQAVFSKQGTKVDFLTTISLGSGNGNLKKVDFEEDTKTITLKIKNREFNIII